MWKKYHQVGNKYKEGNELHFHDKKVKRKKGILLDDEGFHKVSFVVPKLKNDRTKKPRGLK
jgi:gluconate kinase